MCVDKFFYFQIEYLQKKVSSRDKSSKGFYKIILQKSEIEIKLQNNQKSMIGQFAKRPVSRHLSNLRPITRQVSQQNKKQSDECFQVAKKHMIKKQYDLAMKHYINATIHNPENFKAFCNMGRINKQMGKFAQARECYHRAIFSNPHDTISLYNLANLQRVSGNDQVAIVLYSKVINLKQKNDVDVGQLYYDALINQGICFKNLQLYDSAIECNDKAILITPKDASAYFNKSMCLIKKIYSLIRSNFVAVRKKLCIQAEVALKKVIELRPNEIGAKVGLSQLLYLSDPTEGSYTQAKNQLQTLVKIAGEKQRFQIELKIKYCENELQKIDESKIILEPQEDIIDRQNTSNKYDEQSKIRKKTQPLVDTETKLKQGLSIPTIIDQLIAQKRFDQAFQLAKKIPEGIDRYEIQIAINYKQSVATSNQIFLQSAISMYNDLIIKNNQNTPINKSTCSLKGHQTMAAMLNAYGNYVQASKHFEVLLQAIQDQKLGGKKQLGAQQIKEIHVQLGLCYAQRGLIKEAIKEYQQSLKLDPNNYFIMTNLSYLLIQDGQNAVARKNYQEYLKKNGGQKIKDKTVFVDCLINIAISVKDTPEQQKALQKAIQSIEKYFPTYEDIRKKLNEETILRVYLRKIDILEEKSSSSKLNSKEKSEIFENMLDTYLTCLQFQTCPDREAICVNTGILFYLNKCYINALSFFKTVTLHRKVIANNMGLTYLHLQEYEQGISCLEYAVEEYPENIVYFANLHIAKWILGMKQDSLIEKYNCKCESNFEINVAFGLWMLDELTLMIDQNLVKVENDKDSMKTVQSQARNLIHSLIERSQKYDSLKQKSDNDKARLKFIIQKLDEHKRMHNQKSDNLAKEKLVNNNLIELCLRKCENIQTFEQQLSKVFDNLNSLPNNLSNFTIIQTLLSLLFVSNTHLSQLTTTTKSLLIKKLLITLQPQKISTKQFIQSKSAEIAKSIKVLSPQQLLFKPFQGLVRDTQCLIENLTYYMISKIQTAYYSQTSKILKPLSVEYVHPHCQNSNICIRCMIYSSNLYSSIFKVAFGNERKLNKDWSVSQQIGSFSQELVKFVQNNLGKQVNNVYTKSINQIKLSVHNFQLPITIRTHHIDFGAVAQFVKKIDPSLSLSAENSKAKKGFRLVQLNRIVSMQMFWGEEVTHLDRFCTWLARRETNFSHDGILFLGEDLKDLSDIFEEGQKSVEKIKSSFNS